MPTQDFDLFSTSNDHYAEMLAATSQGFSMPNAFFENPFANAMSTLDSMATLQAPVHIPHTGDYISTTQAMHMKHGYSPAASPPHHAYDSMVHAMPSTSAEVTTSAHSTSNSTLGSPALQAQQHSQYHEPWGLGLAHAILPQQTYTTAALEQDLEKQAGFVGESTKVSSSMQSVNSTRPSIQSADFNSAWGAQSNSSGSQAGTPPLTASHSPLEDRFQSPTPSVASLRPHWRASQSLVQSNSHIDVSTSRRGSLLSNQVWPLPHSTPQAPSQALVASPEQLITSPFFNQSSGNFIPPLESSCRLSFSVFSFPLFCTVAVIISRR